MGGSGAWAAVDMILERIEKRKHEQEELQAQLAIEEAKQLVLTEPQVKAFLYSLKHGDIDNENTLRGIINFFLRAVYLYDDRMTLIFDGGKRQSHWTMSCWMR